jgi:hypothetical protein
MLRVGDLIFRIGTFHHTMIISDPMSLSDYALYKQQESHEIEVIHAASIDSSVYRETINIESSELSGNHFTFYRPVDARLNNGLSFAKIWSRYRTKKAPETRGDLTKYSYAQLNSSGADMSRYSGVQQWLHSGQNPPMEFDALYRAFKWATRQRTGFSKNRGTTCCAFITACYQASVIDSLANGDFKKVKKGYDILSELRGEKIDNNLRTSGFEIMGSKQKKISHKALSQYSNPGGFSKKLSIDDYCRFVTKEMNGKEINLADVFPAGLLVDAKYNYSSNFEKLVKAPNSGWQKIM